MAWQFADGLGHGTRRRRRGTLAAMNASAALFAAMPGVHHQTFGPVEIDVVGAGDARIRRSIYPPGMRWSTELRPLVGTDSCQHAHVGFLASGSLHFQYDDGCGVELTAPSFVDIAPGHDAWVVGDEHALLIEVDEHDVHNHRETDA